MVFVVLSGPKIGENLADFAAAELVSDDVDDDAAFGIFPNRGRSESAVSFLPNNTLLSLAFDNDVTAAAGFPNNPRVFDVDFVTNISSSSSATACDVVIDTVSLRLLTFSLRAPADVSARGCDVAAALASSRVDQTLRRIRRLCNNLCSCLEGVWVA